MTVTSNQPRGGLHRGLLVLLVSALTGVLVAGLAFPLVGGFGMLARAGAESFDKLPAELREDPLPQRSHILAADGTPLADVYLNENRILARINDMPTDLIYAIVAIEDARYYQHGGVDVRGLVRAFVRNQQAGAVQQGGSTITQQYVKNVLIESAVDTGDRRKASERSAERKIREAKYAIALERRYTKRQILEKYLNIAYFGSGVYGVGTAAQYYFHKPVKKLTLAESALLAGIVKNPEAYNPVTKPRAAKVRRDVVLRRLLELNFVDHARVERALATPVRKVVPQKLSGFEDNKVAPAFMTYLRQFFLQDPRFGATKEERQARLFQGGLTIRTTLDPKLQRVAQATLDRTLPLRNDPAAAAVVVKPGTGEIRAMAVVNHNPRNVKVNLAVEADSAQAGSTFKAFTLAAALEQGMPLRQRFVSPARYRADPAICDSPDSGYFRNAGDSEAGNFDMPTATWLSVNTYYVQLQVKLGVLKVAQMARRLGVPVSNAVTSRSCSLTLGFQTVAPLDMAAAYATFAAQGLYCRPTPITSVRAPGEATLTIQPDCHQVLERDVANTVTSVLRGVVDGPDPRRTGKGASIGRPAAGKTGTTNGPSAAWFDGYTPDFAGSVWMGHPDAPTRHLLRNVHGVPVVYGGTFPARMWREIMLAAHEGMPLTDFVTPPASALLGKQVAAPSLVGLTPEAAKALAAQSGLTVVVSPQTVPAFPVAAGLVGAQAPPAGTPVTSGSTIVVYLSNGFAGTPTPTYGPSGGPTPWRTPSPTPKPSPTPSPTPSSSPPCHGAKCSPSPTPSSTPPASP